MKNLIYFATLVLALTFAGCSNTEQDIISPNGSQVEKSIYEPQTFPYDLYQTFTEMNSDKISWQDNKTGLLIKVNDVSTLKNSQLFATIEFVNDKDIVMVFLGYLKMHQFYLGGIYAREVKTIRVFSAVINSNFVPSPFGVTPYPFNQFFYNHSVTEWTDDGYEIKVGAMPFPPNMEHLFALLMSREGNLLMFVGKPDTPKLIIPKSKEINLNDLKLFTYQK